MTREEVARDQRARLYGGMIESVARRGYAATTVADVVALAGVSRRAFYEHFSNKEECFLATYDILVARSRKLVIDGWAGERGWSNRRHAAFKAFLEDIAASPKGPRLVLVESLGSGPGVRAHMQLAARVFERLVAFVFQSAPDDLQLPQLAPRAIVGGVRHLLFTRLNEGREEEIRALTDEVLDWTESYRSPLTARLAVSAVPSRPVAPPSPAAFLTREDKRARALGSAIQLTLDEGYGALTDAQIAQFAGISTEAFHEHFADKQECFLAVLDEIVQEMLGWVRERMPAAASWPESVHGAIGAFVEYLLAHEGLFRIAYVHPFEVGPAIVGRMTESVAALTRLLTESAPDPCRGPQMTEEAVTGAILGVVSSYALGHRVTRRPWLVDQLTFIVLAPYIGPKGAVEAIQAAPGG
jgi:AcrR family transcriptional regulator